MLVGDLYKQIQADEAAKAGDAKAVRKCMLNLIESRDTPGVDISKEQFADNLTYVIEKKLTLPVDTANFRVVSMNNPYNTDRWCLALLYGDTVVLKGEESLGVHNCWSGLLHATGMYIHTSVLG